MVPSLKFDNEDIIYLSLNGDTIHDKPEFNLWNDLRTLYKPDIYSEEVFSVEELNIIEKHIDKIKSNPDFKNQQEDKQHNNDEQDEEDKKAIKNFIQGNINDKALIGLGTLSTFDIYDNTCINYDCKDFDNIVNEKEIKKQKRIKEEIELKISLDNISNYKDIYKNLLEGLKNTTDFLQNKFFDDEKSLLDTEIPTEIEKPNEESAQETIEEKKGTKRKRTIEEPNEESKLEEETIEEKKGIIEEPNLEETIEGPKLEEETKGTKRKRTIEEPNEESKLKQETIEEKKETIEEPKLEEDPLEEKKQEQETKGKKRKKQESDEEKQAKKAATAAKSAATKAANKAKAAEKKEALKRNNK
jgi:hypothetical protein